MTAAALLTTMALAIHAGPGYLAHPIQPSCERVYPALIADDSRIMSGNFPDGLGGCVVWLNASYAPALTRQDVCKLTIHEVGHLAGLSHSPNPRSVMYSPYVAKPYPAPCRGRKTR